MGLVRACEVAFCITQFEWYRGVISLVDSRLKEFVSLGRFFILFFESGVESYGGKN